MPSQPPERAQDRQALERLDKSQLVALVLQQQAALERLSAEVERLSSLLAKDSRTSSKPPSSDLIRRSETAAESESDPAAEKTQKRKPGGQPGHRGKTRKGFGRVDRYATLAPDYCPVCGGQHFGEGGRIVRVHQVAQLAERPIEIVEYQQQQRRCAQCGERVVGDLPQGIIAGQQLSARLQGMLSWLGQYGHLSYGKQQEWLREFGALEVSTGTLEATTNRVASAVSGAVARLGQWIRQQPHVHADESPWSVNGLKEWLWAFSGEGYSYFHAGDSRSRAELEQVLGQSFAGVLSSDDFSVYNGYRVRAQQKCLAHLRRHFKQLTRLRAPDQPAIGKAFLELIDEAFAQHRQWRETQDVAAYARWAAGFKGRVEEAIEAWRARAGHAAGVLLRSLSHKAAQWWHFLDHPEVPPDNNRAERALRLGVTQRKVSGGSRSWHGFRRTSILLSAIQTCRAQGRSVVAFFERALALTQQEGEGELSLIPQPD